MKQKKFRTDCAVVIAAALQCTYHILYGLTVFHFSPSLTAIHVGHIFTLLFAGAVMVYVAHTIWEKRSVGKALVAIIGEWKTPYMVLLTVMYLLFLFSGILQELSEPGAIYTNRRHLLDAGISLFAVFPLGYWLGRRGKERFIAGLIDIMTAIYTAMLLVAFYVIYFESSAVVWPGVCIVDGRFQMVASPNTTGMYCAMLMMTGLYRFLKGNRAVKVLYAVAEVVLFLGFSLSDSRASAVSFLLCVAVFVGICLWQRIQSSKNRRKILLLGLLAVLAVAVVWYGRNLGQLFISADKSVDGIAPQVRRLFGDKLGAGSGRVSIWIGILKMLPGEPGILLHGCAPSSIMEVLRVGVGTVEKLGYAINTHNSLLEVLLAYGLPALLVFLAWLVCLARKCWKLGMASSFDEVPLYKRVMPLVVLLLITVNMFESTLFFYSYASGNMFFLAAGYVCGCPLKKTESSQ